MRVSLQEGSFEHGMRRLRLTPYRVVRDSRGFKSIYRDDLTKIEEILFIPVAISRLQKSQI